MAKKISGKPEVVESVVGMIEAIVSALVECIKEAGANVGQCLCHLSSAEGGGTIRKIAELIVAETKGAQPGAAEISEVVSPWTIGIHDVVVDFTSGLKQMILACACKYPVSPQINEKNYPINGVGKVVRKVERLRFKWGYPYNDDIFVRLDEVNQWLCEQGADYRLRFARIEEGLAFIAARGIQGRIAVLGNTRRASKFFSRSRSFVYAGAREGCVEGVSICSFFFELHKDCDFLAVREPVQS